MRTKKPPYTDKRQRTIVKKQTKLKIPKLMSTGFRTGLGGTYGGGPSFNPSSDSTMDTSSPSSDNTSSQGSSDDSSYKKGGFVSKGQGRVIKIKTTKKY